MKKKRVVPERDEIKTYNCLFEGIKYTVIYPRITLPVLLFNILTVVTFFSNWIYATFASIVRRYWLNIDYIMKRKLLFITSKTNNHLVSRPCWYTMMGINVYEKQKQNFSKSTKINFPRLFCR